MSNQYNKADDSALFNESSIKKSQFFDVISEL